MIRFLLAIGVTVCAVVGVWSLGKAYTPGLWKPLINVGGIGITGIALVGLFVGYSVYKGVSKG